jgi:hypothetical protein
VAFHRVWHKLPAAPGRRQPTMQYLGDPIELGVCGVSGAASPTSVTTPSEYYGLPSSCYSFAQIPSLFELKEDSELGNLCLWYQIGRPTASEITGS